MGEAQNRLKKASEVVIVDPDAMGFHLSKVDLHNVAVNPPLSEDEPVPEPSPWKANARIFTTVAKAVAEAAFPRGMGRQDGKIWAAWQEVLDVAYDFGEEGDDGSVPSSYEVTRAMADWLYKHVEDDKVLTKPGMAAWREATVAYFERLRDSKGLKAVPGDPSPAPDPAAS